MIEFECLTDKDGKSKAVVIPIEVWRRIAMKEMVSEIELVSKYLADRLEAMRVLHREEFYRYFH